MIGSAYGNTDKSSEVDGDRFVKSFAKDSKLRGSRELDICPVSKRDTLNPMF